MAKKTKTKIKVRFEFNGVLYDDPPAWAKKQFNDSLKDILLKRNYQYSPT